MGKGTLMKAAIYYNSKRIRVVSPYLYAEYPSGIEGKAILGDAAKLP